MAAPVWRVCDFCLIFVPFGHYDEPEILPYEIPLICSIGADVRQLDEYIREGLCVAVKPRMGNAEVLEALYPLFLKHGRPEFIRSDNGPEFIAENFQTWLTKVGIKPIRIYPGSPWENGYNERFNGTLRREVLNAEWFTSIRQAQIVIETWLKQCNHIRPHQALNMRPPVPETLSGNGTKRGGFTEAIISPVVPPGARELWPEVGDGVKG